MTSNKKQGGSTPKNPPTRPIKDNVLDNSKTGRRYPDTSDNPQRKSYPNTSDTTQNKTQK